MTPSRSLATEAQFPRTTTAIIACACYKLPDNAKPTIFLMATVKIASRNSVQPYSSARSLELTRRKPTILSSRGAGEQPLLAYSPGPGYYCAETCLTELVSFAKGMYLVIDSLLD
jgi:hypothetical protein